MLPSITNVINLADSHDRAAFAMVTHVKQEPRERENSESKEEVVSARCPSLRPHICLRPLSQGTRCASASAHTWEPGVGACTQPGVLSEPALARDVMLLSGAPHSGLNVCVS